MYTIIEYSPRGVTVHGYSVTIENACLYAYNLAKNDKKTNEGNCEIVDISQMDRRNEHIIKMYNCDKGKSIAEYRCNYISPITDEDINELVDIIGYALQPEDGIIRISDLLSETTHYFLNQMSEKYDITEQIGIFNEFQIKYIPTNRDKIKDIVKLMFFYDEWNISWLKNVEVTKSSVVFAVIETAEI